MRRRRSPAGSAVAAAAFALALALAGAGAGCGREDEAPGSGGGRTPAAAPALGSAAEGLPFPPKAFEPGAGPAQAEEAGGRMVEVGGRPEGIAVDPESGLAAIGVKGPDQLVLLDVRTGEIARRVPLSSAPRHVQLAQPGGPFLVPAEATDELVEVFPDGRTRATKVGDNPHDATWRDGTAWTADEFSSTVSEVRDGRTVRREPVDVQPGGIVALRDGMLAVVSVRAYTVELLDRELRTLGSQNVGYGPSHVVADRQDRLWIADTRGGGLSVFETQPRLRFIARVALPGSPYGLAMDRERDRLWVTRTARNEVAEVDVAGRPRVLRTLPTVPSRTPSEWIPPRARS
jgi:DNA-binding beta-propeller fold protein YncE